MDLKLTSTLDQDANDESWGVRDVQVLVQVVPEVVNEEDKKHTYAAFTSQTFSDIDGWSVLNAAKADKKDWITACGKIRVLGGYDVLGTKATISKQFTLAPHY